LNGLHARSWHIAAMGDAATPKNEGPKQRRETRSRKIVVSCGGLSYSIATIDNPFRHLRRLSPLAPLRNLQTNVD
jgi:hypothetical protein